MEGKTNCEVVHFLIEVEGKKYLNSKDFIELYNTVALEVDHNKGVSYGNILDACLKYSQLTENMEPTTISKITLYLPEREPNQEISQDTGDYDGKRQC